MFKENLKAYINRKTHEITSCFFSYYKLGCRSFELNLVSHCFNLKDFNLNLHFEDLRKDSLFALQPKCPKCVLFTLRDRTHRLKKTVLIYKNEKSST